MIKISNDFRLYEKKNKQENADIVIVNIQETSDQNLDSLFEYCRKYNRIFQINNKPEYTFPNQVGIYENGTYKDLDISEVEQYFTPEMVETVKYKLENIPFDGEIFSTKYNSIFIYLGPNSKHRWFYCDEKLVSLFENFKKLQRNVILIGKKQDASNIYLVMSALGLKVSTNSEFIF